MVPEVLLDLEDHKEFKVLVVLRELKEHKENKEHPNALYLDIREEAPGCIKQQPNFSVQPDYIQDYRELHAVPTDTFAHIAWDIPHLFRSTSGLITTKYGALDQGSGNWQDDLRRGFEELWRVLKMHGTFCKGLKLYLSE